MNPSQGFLRHITACTRHDLSRFTPLRIGGQDMGWIAPELADLLSMTKWFTRQPQGVELQAYPEDFHHRSATLAVAALWVAECFSSRLRGEMYPVIKNWGDTPLAEIDRAAVPWFGVRGYGVHVNGFVRRDDGLYMWIAERAADRLVDPGKLDNMIGGGLPIGLTVEENLAKEAWEEAAVPAKLAATAIAVGSLSYKVEMMGGLRNDTLFVYDLELPEDFTPRNTDGEVERFTLMPLADVAAIIHDTDRFKFNCNLVLIDFMLRHNFIGPDHPEYAALIAALKPLREQQA